MSSRHYLTAGVLLIGAVAASGCSKPAEAYRGAGLQVDTLTLNDLVGVYRAALAGSFTLDDPSLWLLTDRVFLPRHSGLVGGDTIPPELIGAMRARGVVKGTCQLPVRDTRVPLICRADRAGYAVRFSEPFALGRDSLQVHVVVQQYAIPDGPRAERLRFERAYHIARRGSGWRAVREARLPQP